MFVHEFLERSRKKYPEKIALIWGDQQLSYKKLDEMAARFASALIEHGIQKGDRVVIVTPNSVETIVALFGVLKAGGVFLVVHHSIKEKKLSYIVKDCGAQAIVLFHNQLPAFRTVLETNESLHCMFVCGDEDGNNRQGASRQYPGQLFKKTIPRWRDHPRYQNTISHASCIPRGALVNLKGLWNPMPASILPPVPLSATGEHC